jgi:hypothetical protein
MLGHSMRNLSPAHYVWIAAALFAVSLLLAVASQPWRTLGVNAIAPNQLAGLAALGFALAGGMALIASALAPRSGRP